jgi:hypothetical protein
VRSRVSTGAMDSASASSSIYLSESPPDRGRHGRTALEIRRLTPGEIICQKREIWVDHSVHIIGHPYRARDVRAALSRSSSPCLLCRGQSFSPGTRVPLPGQISHQHVRVSRRVLRARATEQDGDLRAHSLSCCVPCIILFVLF